MPITITHPRVIICEGPSDQKFLENLIESKSILQFDILHSSGKSGYERTLSALTVAPGFVGVRGILIVGDNDDDPAAAFRSIREQIESVNRVAEIQRAGGYGVPDRPQEVARSEAFPPVVLLMLPWTGQSGCLETLLLEAVYDASPDLKKCVDAYSRCTKTDVWGVVEQSKMRLQALISAICKSDPNTPPAWAWDRHETIIPLDRNCFDPIAAFLRDFDRLVQVQ